MPYVEQSDIEGRLPAAHLVEALDDDADGSADDGVWDKVAADASEAVDGYLSQRFEVPFADPPELVKLAAKLFALEIIYQRRGVPEDKNPFAAEAGRMRMKLERIAREQEPLISEGVADAERRGAPVTVIGGPSKAVSSSGALPG